MRFRLSSLSVDWVITATAAFLVLVLVGVFGVRLFDAVSSLRAAPEDNVQWSLAQLEVDLLKLSNAALAAANGEGDVADVRQGRLA